jgi:hypothetical protein
MMALIRRWLLKAYAVAAGIRYTEISTLFLQNCKHLNGNVQLLIRIDSSCVKKIHDHSNLFQKFWGHPKLLN